MTDSTDCSCPSGDGSLRWPCPVHPPLTTVPPVAPAPLRLPPSTRAGRGPYGVPLADADGDKLTSLVTDTVADHMRRFTQLVDAALLDRVADYMRANGWTVVPPADGGDEHSHCADCVTQGEVTCCDCGADLTPNEQEKKR